LLAILIYLLIGALAGTLAGLLGIGGGLVIVPILLISFQLQGFAPEVLTHSAIGTSLAIILITAISSASGHQRRGAVRWDIVRWIVPGLMLGSLLGAKLADAINGRLLQGLFGGYALIIAIRMALDLKPKANRQLPAKPVQLVVGGVVGSISALFGIGGSSMTIPYLVRCNVDIKQAIGTSASCNFPLALVGALSYWYLGVNAPNLPAWSSGYIYWPAFLGITLTSFIFARLGARLTHRLNAKLLKRIFAALLVLVSAKLIYAVL
jgi:uncharacterized membrane protein YfcA